MSKAIQFAVIGYGFIGRRHAEIIKGHPECELAAIADTDSNRQQVAKEEQEGVPVYASQLQLLEAQPSIDVVTIATPNDSHSPCAIEALNNRRHVVIEKPMGLDRSACEEVIFKALQASRQVFCVMQNRYTPTAEWLKQLLINGHLGDIIYVNINCFWNRDTRYYKPGGWKGTLEHDGGTLFTQFSHFIDVMYWVFGDIKNITARFQNRTHHELIEFEDTGHASFEFVNGGLASLNFTTSVWDTNQESSITIVGEKGSVKVGGQYMNSVDYCHIDNYEQPTLREANPPNDYGAYKGSAANHHYIFENVVDTLRGTASPATNALEGMKVVEIIERIYAAADRPIQDLKL